MFEPLDTEFTSIAQHGFLPVKPPKTHFPENSEFSFLDEIGNKLPLLLESSDFRNNIKHLDIPYWPEQWPYDDQLAYLQLYYLRLGFLASAYINQVGFSKFTELPANLAMPLYKACQILQRPPILSYDGYALYNWKKLKDDGPIALGNIDTIQNFVQLYDEHWFILVHVEIEAIAAEIFSEVIKFPELIKDQKIESINKSLDIIAKAVRKQEEVLKRIPENMDPALYYKTFRPYIRYFENVHYLGTDLQPQNQRGETGAQSSIMPCLVAFMKIPHKPSVLTNHLLDMRNYMPHRDRLFIQWIEQLPAFKQQVSAESFNAVLDAIADFRKVHFSWAEEYINRRTNDPRGTGGTPYMLWLKQLIDETLEHKK